MGWGLLDPATQARALRAPAGFWPRGADALPRRRDQGSVRERQATDRLWDAHRDAIAAVVDKLTDDQKAALRDILDTLNADG